MMSFDSLEILQKPTGKVVFVACDSRYFEIFSDELTTSFTRHINSFNCLHFHIISPTENILEKISHPSNSSVTYSFEDSTQINEINETSLAGLPCFADLPRKIKSMLILEQERDNKITSYLIPKLLRLHFPVDFLLSYQWLNISKSRVYFACRRFMMPMYFFDSISSVLIIDIDSYFNRDVSINMDVSSVGAFAVSRKDSWSKFLAGFVYVKMNQQGSLFLNKMRNDVTKSFWDGLIYWGLDQVLLDKCGEVGLLACLPSVDVGFAKNSNASFVSLKGNLKWHDF